MRFAILGAGALGTILGAHLSRAGHEVVMIARGERARVLQRQGLVLNGLSDIKARPTVIDDPQKLRRDRHADRRHQGHRLRAGARHARAPAARQRVLGAERRAQERTAGARLRLLARARRHGGFLRRAARQWRGEVHAQRLPAPGRGEGRHEPARGGTGRGHRRGRRALRGGVQHPHARMVEVRRLDRAVSARRAHAPDHLEIPHGRTQRAWSSCASCARPRRSRRR